MAAVPLKLNHLQKRYGRTQVLAGVDLTVAPGEFLSLVGPKGCGKTMLLSILAGHEKPDFGRVLLNGRDITGLPPGKRGLGALFGDTPLFPRRTVEANVAYALKLQGVPRGERHGRAQKLLAMADLSGLGKKRPGILTPFDCGMALAVRALATAPKALLLDDPFTRLPAAERRRILAFLKAMQQQWHFSILYATRDLEEAMAVSHRLALMRDGRVEQAGTPEEVYHLPQSVASALFLGPANLLPCVVAARRPDGMVALEMEGLTIPAKAYGPPPTIGEDMFLCIRPEQVEMSASPHRDSLLSAVFSGLRTVESRQWAVASLPTGQELLCKVPAEAVKPGKRVFLRWDTDLAALLSAEEEKAPPLEAASEAGKGVAPWAV